jgi:hypothetical protein
VGEVAASSLIDANLRLVYEAGRNEKGEPVLKTKGYNNVKVSATTDQIFQAAQAIASLCALPLFTIERTNVEEILG